MSQTRREAHSLYVFILSFHWHKLINDVILQRITYNNYLVEIGRYRWLHYQGFACVACRDYHLIPSYLSFISPLLLVEIMVFVILCFLSDL